MFCRQSTVLRCLKFIPISCMGPKHAPKDKRFDFSTNLYALEHGLFACYTGTAYADTVSITEENLFRDATP